MTASGVTVPPAERNHPERTRGLWHLARPCVCPPTKSKPKPGPQTNPYCTPSSLTRRGDERKRGKRRLRLPNRCHIQPSSPSLRRIPIGVGWGRRKSGYMGLREAIIINPISRKLYSKASHLKTQRRSDSHLSAQPLLCSLHTKAHAEGQPLVSPPPHPPVPPWDVTHTIPLKRHSSLCLADSKSQVSLSKWLLLCPWVNSLIFLQVPGSPSGS